MCIYMGIMIIYHGKTNPMYNAHKKVGAHYTWQNTVGVFFPFCVPVVGLFHILF